MDCLVKLFCLAHQSYLRRCIPSLIVILQQKLPVFNFLKKHKFQRYKQCLDRNSIGFTKDKEKRISLDGVKTKVGNDGKHKKEWSKI